MTKKQMREESRVEQARVLEKLFEISRNPFYPVNCQFEVLGFTEEFQDGETFRMLGTRTLEEPDRPCGSPGRRLYELTAPLDLLKGYKQIPVTIKASPEHPRKVIATIQIMCGREVRKSEMEKYQTRFGRMGRI